MSKRKHKYYIGQLVRMLNSPYVAERFRGKYGYIQKHANASSVLIGQEPEYDIIIQAIPDHKWRVFQRELQEVTTNDV